MIAGFQRLPAVKSLTAPRLPHWASQAAFNPNKGVRVALGRGNATRAHTALGCRTRSPGLMCGRVIHPSACSHATAFARPES